MGENSTISWTDHTFNPWRGCEHATLPDGSKHPGCLNCYAEAMSKRNPGLLGEWGPEGRRVVGPPAYWNMPRKWNAAAEKAGQRHRVFCASLADVFEDWQGPLHDHKGNRLVVNGSGAVFHVTNSWQPLWRERMMTLDDLRRDLFALIDATPWLDWLLLTKRPQNVLRMTPTTVERWARLAARQISNSHSFTGHDAAELKDLTLRCDRYRPNVWLITSVSDQATANALLPELFKCRDLVPVLGVSAEPLLSAVDFERLTIPGSSYVLDVLHGQRRGTITRDIIPEPGMRLDWVIVGGESGGGRRDCGEQAIVQVAKRCKMAAVPVHVKQDCAFKDGQQGRIPDEVWAWKEYPQVAA